MDTDVLNEFYGKLPVPQRDLYQTLAKEAMALGYKPIRDKTKSFSVSFRNNALKFTIMKFVEEDKAGCFWKLKFSANKTYSRVFDESIKRYMEKTDFRYTGCLGCKICVNNGKSFYTIKYDDGRTYRICGLVFFMEMCAPTKEMVAEAGTLLREENAYYILVKG